MMRAAERLLARSRGTQEREEERRTLMEGLAQTKRLISQAYSGFNTACDPDLIESYVYEINALEARYAYLLRRVKALEGAPDRLDAAPTLS